MGAFVSVLEVLRLGTEDVQKWNATFIKYNPADGTAIIHVNFIHSIDKFSILFYAFALVTIILLIVDTVVESRISEYKEELLEKEKKKGEDPLTETLLNKI